MPRRGHQVGPADYAVLGLLAVRPRHGYELAAYFAPGGDLEEVCRLGLSQLYALLHALSELGYIDSTEEPGAGGPPRRIFRLAGPGADLFRRWLQAPVERIRQIRTDFLLKLYFSRHLGDHDTAALIDNQIVASRRYLSGLEGALARAAADSFEELVLSSRVNAAAAAIRWLTVQSERIKVKGGPTADA